MYTAEKVRGAEGIRAISHGKLNGRVSAHKAKSYETVVAHFRETLSTVI